MRLYPQSPVETSHSGTVEHSRLYGLRRPIAVLGATLVSMAAMPVIENASAGESATSGGTSIEGVNNISGGAPEAVPKVDYFRIINKTHLPQTAINKFERAEEAKSIWVSKEWGAARAKFTNSTKAWPITLMPYSKQRLQYMGAAGYHSVNNGKPFAEVLAGVPKDPPTRPNPKWTVILGHEVDEMLPNPHLAHFIRFDQNGTITRVTKEIDDPVYQLHLWVKGVLLSDSATESDFNGGPPPYDEMGVLTQAGDLTHGYLVTSSGSALGEAPFKDRDIKAGFIRYTGSTSTAQFTRLP